VSKRLELKRHADLVRLRKDELCEALCTLWIVNWAELNVRFAPFNQVTVGNVRASPCLPPRPVGKNRSERQDRNAYDIQPDLPPRCINRTLLSVPFGLL